VLFVFIYLNLEAYAKTDANKYFLKQTNGVKTKKTKKNILQHNAIRRSMQ